MKKQTKRRLIYFGVGLTVALIVFFIYNYFFPIEISMTEMSAIGTGTETQAVSPEIVSSIIGALGGIVGVVIESMIYTKHRR